MALDYIASLLQNAIRNTSTIEVRGRVEKVVGTIIYALVPEV